MWKSRSSTRTLVAVVLLLGPHSALAVTVDGRLDPDYGLALSTQTTQTGLGDNHAGQLDDSQGSELDEAYGYIGGGVLHLFLSGNLTFYWTLEGTTVWVPIDLFIDSKPGGQNQLLSNNPTIEPSTYDLSRMAGLSFDSGFEPDYWLSLGGDGWSWPNLKAFYAELPSGGGGAGVALGSTLCGGPGTLSGGSNPFGILATMDDRNVAGVTQGCGTSSGAGVTTGIEWAIPLAAIGNPSGCVNVCAIVPCGGRDCITNQVLGPLPPGTCGPLPSSSVNFAAIPGNQYFTVCPSATPARSFSWGKVKTIYR